MHTQISKNSSIAMADLSNGKADRSVLLSTHKNSIARHETMSYLPHPANISKFLERKPYLLYHDIIFIHNT
jgi:hypothetical protein